MNIRTLLLLSPIFLFSTTIAYAGFYGDLNLGADFVKTSKDLTYPVNKVPPTHSSFSSSYNDFHGQIALGYNFMLQCPWQLAIEGNADLYTGQASAKIDNWFFSTSAKATEKFNNGVGLFLLPKYQLNDKVQLFIGPGISGSQFEISSSGTTGGNIGLTGNSTQWLLGWGFKAGTALTLTPAFDLLLTYQYTDYQSITKTTVEPLSGQSVKSKYRPSSNSVMMGIRWYIFGR